MKRHPIPPTPQSTKDLQNLREEQKEWAYRERLWQQTQYGRKPSILDRFLANLRVPSFKAPCRSQQASGLHATPKRTCPYKILKAHELAIAQANPPPTPEPSLEQWIDTVCPSLEGYVPMGPSGSTAMLASTPEAKDRVVFQSPR